MEGGGGIMNYEELRWHWRAPFHLIVRLSERIIDYAVAGPETDPNVQEPAELQSTLTLWELPISKRCYGNENPQNSYFEGPSSLKSVNACICQ